jgi:hypothetical protein
MAEYDRIDRESETHRTEKALKTLMPSVRLPLDRGTVEIVVAEIAGSRPGGQLLLTMLTHLLARMKGVVRRIHIIGTDHEVVHEGVPLVGSSVFDGLSQLVSRLSGSRSEYHVELVVGASPVPADVRVALGDAEADIRLGSDAWRAMVGAPAASARWMDRCPLGPFMAATIGGSEVLKLLLQVNFGWSEGRRADPLVFSILNYGVDDGAMAGPDIDKVHLDDLGLAGAGAGGTAAMYTLASFPKVHGRLIAVEPGQLKVSSLGRYLMTDYAQVHSGIAKLDSLGLFLRRHAPELVLESHSKYWRDVELRWRSVVCTVDTPEARWEVQRSPHDEILEAGVMGTLYAALRVVPGGWCLECKHPHDPDVTWKRRAARWGLTTDEVKRRDAGKTPVACADLVRLADVQGRPVEEFLELDGVPFDEIPARTECGETPLSLAVPGQAPVLPIATTAAGVVLAAEVVKQIAGVGQPLSNYFAHDLRFRPRADRHRFKPRLTGCRGCPSPSVSQGRSLLGGD